MTKRSLPTPEELRQLLRYDPETGKLYWKPRPDSSFATLNAAGVWNARFCGKEALACVDDGYRTGFLKGRRVRAHRIAWAIYYGEYPENQVDHINRVRSDNRICNLRASSGSENQWNTVTRSSSKSGLKGVRRNGSTGRWMARITVNGDRKYLGNFESAEAAHAAYCAAAQKYHGEFARTK